MPPATFFDCAPVHLLTTATLAKLSAFYPGGRFEPRRFRPNILVATGADEDSFVENTLGRQDYRDWPRSPHQDYRQHRQMRHDHARPGWFAPRFGHSPSGGAVQPEPRRGVWRGRPARHGARARPGEPGRMSVAATRNWPAARSWLHAAGPHYSCQIGNPMLTSGNGKEFRTLDRIRFINSRRTA